MAETATEQRLNAEREVRGAMLFERMVENFVKTWCPKDGYDKTRFVAELMGIVRQTTMDVQKQANEQTMAVMRNLAVLAQPTLKFYDDPTSDAIRNPLGKPPGSLTLSFFRFLFQSASAYDIDKIEVGDPKEKVVKLFGRPYRVEKPGIGCAEEWLYTIPFRVYVSIGLDSAGRVKKKYRSGEPAHV